MLFKILFPLLSRLSLKIDMQASGDDKVTLTILPRRREGAPGTDDAAELRPISMTGTVAELDAELAKGEDGAFGQLIAARKTLSDQIADQLAAEKQATEDRQKQAASKTAKPKTTPSAPQPAPAKPSSAPAVPSAQPAAPTGDPEKPASLW